MLFFLTTTYTLVYQVTIVNHVFHVPQYHIEHLLYNKAIC